MRPGDGAASGEVTRSRAAGWGTRLNLRPSGDGQASAYTPLTDVLVFALSL